MNPFTERVLKAAELGNAGFPDSNAVPINVASGPLSTVISLVAACLEAMGPLGRAGN